MKTIRAEFITVDLDLKSARDLTPLLEAWGNRAIRTHDGRTGRRYWMRFVLARSTKDPAGAILAFNRLVQRLPKNALRRWNEASKEFDVGIQAGFEHRTGEWLLTPRVIDVVHALRASVRLTVYSPLPLLAERRRTRQA